MLHSPASKLAVIAAVCLFGIRASHSAYARPYTLIDLGSLLPGSTDSFALGVNNAGQVVGGSTIDNGVPVFWSGGTATILPTLGGTTYAEAINNAGQAVGFGVPFGETYALLWNGGDSKYSRR